MPAQIDEYDFEAEIDRSEMGADGDTGLAKDRCREVPAEPRRMLKHFERVSGIEGDDSLPHRRQIIRLTQHSAPFLQPRMHLYHPYNSKPFSTTSSTSA